MNCKHILYMAAIAAGAMTLSSCDDDKIYDLGHSEALLISEIHFDYEGDITLPVGQEVSLNAKAMPEEAAKAGIVYKTTDKNIAYIDDNGTLHCVGEGIANVSAVPSIGFGATAALTVNVVDHVVYTESLEVMGEAELPEYIYEGDSFNLKAIAMPEDHTYNFLTWHTSNPEVAEVDEKGVVTCSKPGQVVITAETRFPDKAGIKGSIELVVCEPVDVERVEIAPLTEAVCLTRPFDLEVTYYPSHGTKGSVEWSSSDESVAFVNRGHVVPSGFGTCTLTAKCTNGETTSVNVTVTTGWYIWDPVNKYNPWSAGSNAKFSFDNGNVLKVTMSEMKPGGDWRGDIMLVNDENHPVAFHFGEYPVIALRATIPPNGRNTFDGVSIDNVNAGNPQCNEGRFASGNPIELADGSKLIYVDFKARGIYSTTRITEMKLLQLKVADIPAADIPADKSYTVYWIRTFRSVEEMKSFAEAEVAGGK